MSTSTRVIITHRSARCCWKCVGSPGFPTPALVRFDPLPKAGATKLLCDTALRAMPPDFLQGELDVLVGHRHSYRHISGAVVHQCSLELPAGSFYALSDPVFIVSPELLFLQFGSFMQAPQLVAYGMELCSSYCLDWTTGGLKTRHSPLTSPRKLGSYIDAARGLPGSSAAASALRWVCAGAESPMEVKTAMLLCLPRRLGGYGLPLPELNRPIEPGRLSSLADRSFYRPDASWKEHKVALEYDGKESHEDAHKDKRRINSLESLGWKVFSVTSHDIRDYKEFERIALGVARCIGFRVRKSNGWIEKALQLRTLLGLP